MDQSSITARGHREGPRRPHDGGIKAAPAAVRVDAPDADQ